MLARWVGSRCVVLLGWLAAMARCGGSLRWLAVRWLAGSLHCGARWVLAGLELLRWLAAVHLGPPRGTTRGPHERGRRRAVQTGPHAHYMNNSLVPCNRCAYFTLL